MPRQLVYIASLSHSGSTLLDLILGGHAALTGLGEIALTIDQAPDVVATTREAYCSCGKKLSTCAFWGSVEERLNGEVGADFVRRYELVLDEFDAQYGRSQIAIDSSKYLPILKIVDKKIKIKLKVIHLVKDVRNYAISQLDKHRGKAGKSAYRHFRAWHRGNRQFHEYVHSQEIPFIRVGYEELCLRPDVVLPRIYDFLDIEPQAEMLDIAKSSSHILRGNRMRGQVSKRRLLQYDHRWFCRREWLLPSLLYPGIMRFNTKYVYGNGLSEIWSGR